MNDTIRFPTDFLWGAATSAYQIEGSPLADGAGASIWHRFSHIPGATRNGDTGDIACDHYHRWREDVALMRELGLQAYRFSIAWARVLPAGRGAVNRAGIDFYDRLVDTLLEAGIQPFPTLYHWDLPAALDDEGGWLNADIAHWFADYASTMYRAFGDRVTMWTTLNEPWVTVDAGYLHGAHAPGHRCAAEVPVASHNLLRAHGAAVRAFRSEAQGRIGIVVNLEPKYPASNEPDDLAAVGRADAYMNRQYLDPLLLGRYPEELAGIFGDDWPAFPSGDMETIREPIDFLGVNYYTRAVVRHDDGARPVRAVSVPQTNRPRTSLGWEVHPESFTRVLCWIRERYGEIPIYITENGAAFHDPPPGADGFLDDQPRVAYYREHLRAVRAAMDAGVGIRGYFAWSLLDNFEWACGYDERFGIVHVDFETLARTPKASAYFYREVIRSGGAALGEC